MHNNAGHRISKLKPGRRTDRQGSVRGREREREVAYRRTVGQSIAAAVKNGNGAIINLHRYASALLARSVCAIECRSLCVCVYALLHLYWGPSRRLPNQQIQQQVETQTAAQRARNCSRPKGNLVELFPSGADGDEHVTFGSQPAGKPLM